MVRLFSTTIHSELGTDAEVEISAAANLDTDPRLIGILLRDVSRRLLVEQWQRQPARRRSARSPNRSGKTPLRKLVRNTVGVVEQHYVKAALELGEREPHGGRGNSRAQPSKSLC